MTPADLAAEDPKGPGAAACCWLLAAAAWRRLALLLRCCCASRLPRISRGVLADPQSQRRLHPPPICHNCQ